jgi:hypothetical protein
MEKTGKIVTVALLLCGIGLLAYLFLDWSEKVKDASKTEVEEERKKWEKEVEQLEAVIADLQRQAQEEGPKVSPDKEAALFGPDPTVPSETEIVGCEELKARVLNFFHYLDGRDYIKDLKMQETSAEYYNRVMADVSQAIPVVSEVALDFETLMLNTIHFFRVVKKENIELFKKVLANEGENLEMVMREFFAYFATPDQCQDEAVYVPSPAVRYEYAGFFLNTLGGKAYLFRRDSRIRILVTYYSVLALHEANEKLLNRHGVDIRPHLNNSLEEIGARNDLLFQREYLERLFDIQSSYPQFTTDEE